MTRTAMLLLIMINIPMYVGVGHLFFKGWHDFKTSLKLLYKNRHLVFDSGWDAMSDYWHEIRVVVYLLACLTLTLCELHLISSMNS